MPLAYVVCALLCLFVWQVPITIVAAATINGVIVAATLIFIIFGAIALLNTLQESGGLHAIRRLRCQSIQYPELADYGRPRLRRWPGFDTIGWR